MYSKNIYKLQGAVDYDFLRYLLKKMLTRAGPYTVFNGFQNASSYNHSGKTGANS